MTCLISQLTPSFSARPPRNEICREDVWSAGPLCVCWPMPSPEDRGLRLNFPAQLVNNLELARRRLKKRRHGRGGEAPGMKWCSPLPGVGTPGSSEGDRFTHRVQLPLEYDEGHKTNNDE